MEHNGSFSEANTTAQFPETNMGHNELTKPSSPEFSGATNPTTPIGSINEKLK